jgi:hypothetical protein
MAMVSTTKGLRAWAKNRGISEKDIHAFARTYQKESGVNLQLRRSYFPNQREDIEKSRLRMVKFFDWVLQKKAA